MGKRESNDTFQQQTNPLRQLPPNPSHRKRPQNMSMRHKQHITTRRFLLPINRRKGDSRLMKAAPDIGDQAI